ncbi:translation machinery-associated protein 20 [Thecaphora frezii]
MQPTITRPQKIRPLRPLVFHASPCLGHRCPHLSIHHTSHPIRPRLACSSSKHSPSPLRSPPSTSSTTASNQPTNQSVVPPSSRPPLSSSGPATMSLFKKFDPKVDISSSTAVKSSVQRAMRGKLLDSYPALAENDGALLEQIWPKKEPITLVKFSREHVQMLVYKGEVLFFQHFDEPYLPSLKVLHRYPFLLPSVQVDRGAIRFLLSGANVMSPGLVSAGGKLPDPSSNPEEKALEVGQGVAVRAQGKDEVVAVGLMKMSSEEIRKTGKGIGIDNIHYIGDDLWMALARGGL